jgi:hypothetical protein
MTLVCGLGLTKVQVENGIRASTAAVHSLNIVHRQAKANQWLNAPDPSLNYNEAQKHRHPGSGIWFLKCERYSTWKTSQNSFLWLHGIPGCGKTVLTSTIIGDLKNSNDLDRFTLYFYFDFTDPNKQTVDGMLRSLINHVCYLSQSSQGHLESLFVSCEQGNRQPTHEELQMTFLQMIREIGDVWIVLDAIDECRTRQGAFQEALLCWIRDLISQQHDIHLLITSRPEEYIDSEIREWAPESPMEILNDAIMGDISDYVSTRVRLGNGLKRWRSRPNVQSEIESAITKKSGGM